MGEELPARIAVVHDWLVDYAGSERVLAEILRCLPQADLYTLVDHMPAAQRAPLGGRVARTEREFLTEYAHSCLRMPGKR